MAADATRFAAVVHGVLADAAVAQGRGETLVHDLRVAAGRDEQPTAAIFDGRTLGCPLGATPERGTRAGFDGAKCKHGSKVYMAIDTLDHLLALHVTPANEQERAQVDKLAGQVQAVTGDNVEVAFIDQGYTGPKPAQAAAAHEIERIVVKLPEAKKGFVRLPKRWVVERSFAWTGLFRRLARDYERLPTALAVCTAWLLLA